MDDRSPDDLHTRRFFLSRASFGVGSAALFSLLGGVPGSGALFGAAPPRTRLQPYPGVIHPRDFPARAKRVIFLCMAGGPSQLETFDYKPRLAELDGQPMPRSVTEGQPIAQLQTQKLKILGPRACFRRHGKSGQMISDLLPWTARIADEITIVRSMTTTQINHDPAHTVMNTGTALSGRPSMGSWVTYGLGADVDDLPGFIVLSSIKGRNPQPIASRQWHSGPLPSRFQGVEFHAAGDPVHYLSNPPGVSPGRQRDVFDAIAALNRQRQARVSNPEIETRLSQYELAFRMQTSVPELMDLSSEPPRALDLYGPDVHKPGTFAHNCLLARRLAERGVRFIQLYHRGWDHHGDLDKWMKVCCGATDQPTAALILDLKQRGMLDDTLVVWGGEFGRTPMFQGNKGAAGRDHHIKGFTIWLAGGGIRRGITYGATDDLGYHAVVDPVSVHDLHATMLYLLGIDHARFTHKFQGLDLRLTGVEPARVVHSLIA